MSQFFLDFETRSMVDIKKAGVDAYARHPSTDILCVGFARGDEPAQVFDPLIFMASDAETWDCVVAHNAPFELAIWNHVGTRLYGWPPLEPEQTVCTMAMCYAMALPGALADAANAVGLPIQKDSAGHRVMMQLSQPREIAEDGSAIWWEPGDAIDKFEKLYSYCKTDIEVERQLYQRLVKLSDSERELWLLDRKINDRGVQVDLRAVKAALRIVEVERERLDRRMREVTEGAVATCTAVGQLADWLVFNGVYLKGVSKSDILAALDDVGLPSVCRQALLIRQEAAKSSTAKLESMLSGVCEDGRLRGLFQYYGAGATGRFAGRRIQPQNFPRGALGLSEADVDGVFQLLETVS